MRISSFITLIEESKIVSTSNFKWCVEALPLQNSANIFLKAVNDQTVLADLVIEDITQSHMLYEALDQKLEQIYSYPRFGLIFVSQLTFKNDVDSLKLWHMIQDILNEYFNGYVLADDLQLLQRLNLHEKNCYQLTFSVLNNSYVFNQNPSLMM